MRTRTTFVVALVLGGFGTGGVATSFAQDDDVRGASLTTRPKPAEKSSSSATTSVTSPSTTSYNPGKASGSAAVP